jgi:hypothetical protein
MKASMRPVALNEVSYNVALLHSTLSVFGLPVSKEEAEQNKAGENTRQQVRALQDRLNVTADPSTLVDDATIAAMADALSRRGLTTAERSFVVTGTVRFASGSLKKRQDLLAFDVDLRGVAALRTAKTTGDLDQSGGFEFLGRTKSDNRGRYRIDFFDWQYRRAERNKADVVVFAVEKENDSGARIIGRSRLVSADDYSEKGLVSGLTVVVQETDNRTEYETAMGALEPFLKDSNVQLDEIAGSFEQLSFTARELEIDPAIIRVAAAAELLRNGKASRLSHELLYSIGRQGITLSPAVLSRKSEVELRGAIARSIEQHTIRAFDAAPIAAFLKALHQVATGRVLTRENSNGTTLNDILAHALPKESQRVAFLGSLATFQGRDFREFWNEHLPAQPEFKDQPDLIANLLFTQQLTLITGNHQPLVTELRANSKITSVQQLLDFEPSDWLDIVKRVGVPDFVEGTDDQDRARRYADQMQGLVDAAFSTERIGRMVANNRLPIEKNAVSKALATFLSNTKEFDFASSRVHDFEKELRSAAGDHFDETRNELMKIQRVFQVSTSPKAMSPLLESGLHSAYTIANIPRKSFLRTYGASLGGEQEAFAIHQRASHIAARSEHSAMLMMEYSQAQSPGYATDQQNQNDAVAVLQNRLPNYSELFGSPDLCECEHCRSVCSAAAYFVDLLRFLWRGEPNDDGNSPLDMLTVRRPDLVHLPLTCENTNTIIPYLDLANEVMEHYTANGSLASFEGYDTGEATADELRANPQNFNLDAYRKIKDAKYPFALPYHQPLDVIRTYSNHLKVSRYDAMRAMNPNPDSTTASAIAAESLRISQEEYTILTGKAFDGTPDAALLHEYFGYTAPPQLENLSKVREILARSGMAYRDLVELVKTQFINPGQTTLDFLQQIFSNASLDPKVVYKKLGQIKAGTLHTANDAELIAALNAYNAAQESNLTPGDFDQWVTDHLGEFQQVLTLYEPDSKCSLDTTKLWTIKSIYEAATTSGISNDVWSKIHRFVRLWRKLGWTIHETDLMLAALGQNDVTTDTISRLEAVSLLATATKLPLNQLATLWGNIDSYGSKSLYKKLFLNKAVQKIDDAFRADAWGHYLRDESKVLADHQSAILAAFRCREDDLNAILAVARVIDGGLPRKIDINSDVLNLPNVSTIYRHVVLAKALKIRTTDLCDLIAVFDASPFSMWDIQNATFKNVAPAETYRFYKLADSVKKIGFKASVLVYILEGTLPPDSNLGLPKTKSLQTARAIRDAFTTIEQTHREPVASPLSADIISSKLALTYPPDVVSRFVGLLQGTSLGETLTDKNLNVVIPPDLAGKYTYVKGSGRLVTTAIVSDTERAALKALPNANASFKAAVDMLYTQPEAFIETNFSGVFSDMPDALATLLDHPAQIKPADIDRRMAYVYENFIPVLKKRLRHDAVAENVAALIRLSNEAAVTLIAKDIESLISDLSGEGFSATYFSDTTWTTAVLKKTDDTIDFSWGASSPAAAVPADNFSVRWETYVAPPASGEYTLVVDVEEADEVFKLYLDDSIILEKSGANNNTSLEVVTSLNAAQMQPLKLEYAETSQNASVRLRWKTATSALEPVPVSAAYPAAVLDSFVEKANVYHRAAKFISGFQLSETELVYLIGSGTDFGNIDFTKLSAEHWQRVRDFVTLRNAVPQAQALLTDVFADAKTVSPAPTVAELREKLYHATAWDELSLEYLVNTYFALKVADFRNEIALNRILDVMQILARTGLAAETIARWGAPETDFDKLNDTAQLIKNTVKSRYDEQDWLEIAGDLSDGIREHQKQALIAYLLTQPAIQSWGVMDADGLFEYFLIDVQMGACMDTSRIVQANSSVQMFVNRCLLNLESNHSNGSQKGVSPDAIDKNRWEWMKNYRVWEANRKVFLYPENWLEPEWRMDRSEFFNDLDSYLVQNDITDRTVEQAFRNYLSSLNDVANLDVSGMWREDYPTGDLKYLHVFARTHNPPYKFFYRRWNEFRKWSPWTRVPVDIRSVDGSPAPDGDNSGVHLVPVVWKDRLLLFWPEFLQVAETPEGVITQSAKTVSEDKMSTMAPVNIVEIRLAFSEFVDGKWTPKQVTKEYLREWPHSDFSAKEKDFLFTPSIAPTTQELTIQVSDTYWNATRGAFTLADIQSAVLSEHYGDARLDHDSEYKYAFSKRKAWKKLELEDDVYLQNSTPHTLLPVDAMQGVDITLENPFFFSDAKRTYFVRPVGIAIVDAVRDPQNHQPSFPGLVDDSGFVPIDIPHIGPDDYMPGLGDVPVHEYYRGSDSKGQEVLLEAGGHASVEIPSARAFTPGSTSMTMSFGVANPMSKTYSMEMAHAGTAFGGAQTRLRTGRRQTGAVRYDTGLEFHTFHHPFSGEYVKRLNQGGLAAMMESDTVLPSDNGSTFETMYNPNFEHGFVQKPSDFATRTYYKQNVCFDVYGANSQYNWELFFHAPLYIATRLSRNGRFEEAMKWFHYIFDPTTDDLPGPGQTELSRYWKVLPFKTTPAENLEDWFRSLSPNADPNTENAIIAEWRNNPFDPHRVAANRPLAYMKNVVFKYVENLTAWADSLFRLDSMESVNEALQIYVIANHILGPRPQFIPKRGEIKAESYDSLKSKWDDFSNALVELENIFPYSSDANVSNSSSGTNLLGVGPALYFCIPPNEKLLEYWDTVGDRLFKIRHCQNIEGVERKLALFAPPIDPGALIQATSQGLSLGSILADLSSPPPIYRFAVLIHKASEFCADVRALGSALLAAFEKRDAEELGRVRASQETQMLELMTAIRERQVLDARVNKENLEKARETASFRLQHYLDLLGNDSAPPPPPPTLNATLTADSQLPADTKIATVETDVDDAPVDSGESGVKVISKEKEELDKNLAAKWTTFASGSMETLAGIFHLFPQIDGEATPIGVGAGAWWGGQNLGAGTSALARAASTAATFLSQEAAQAATMAAFIRREQDYTLQANLAAREVVQLDKQITSAGIRIQIAEKELDNHKRQIDNAKTVEQFLENKFTNQELYQWMREQLFAVYKQSYNLAYDMAKKAEKAYRYETGSATASFIQYGYWESSKQGLVSGERLQFALRLMEKSYLDENRRELELTKSVSLQRLNPLALIELRETGRCWISLPEELFDVDYPGHYYRRIKAVRVSIPCVAGPYTSVNCSLRLLNNSVRINTSMNSEGNYEHENDNGLPLDDDRFRLSYVPVSAIATSTAQDDSGMFELVFKDDRYLPFEGAGVISDWQIELSTEENLRQFDYGTISDVILHLNFTARQNGGLFKLMATSHVQDFLMNAEDLSEQPLLQMFNMKQEFPGEWHKFLHPTGQGAEQMLTVTIGKERFPFFVQSRSIVVSKIDAFARSSKTSSYHLIMSYTNLDGDPVISTQITMPQSDAYGGLNKTTIDVSDAGLNLEELDVAAPMSLKLKRIVVNDFSSLSTDPDEMEDVYLVFHYKVADSA